MLVEWRDELLTGHEEIDGQHKELFVRINRLVVACKEGKGKAEIKNLLQFLGEYVVAHFKAEEQLQVTYKYPHYLSHKGQHDGFLEQLGQLVIQFEAEGATLHLMVQVNKAVFDWLRDHIVGMDKELAEYIRSTEAA